VGDSGAYAQPDSQRARTDTLTQPSGQVFPSDSTTSVDSPTVGDSSTVGDSARVLQPDSVRSRTDTARSSKTRDSTQAAPAVPPAPGDSVLRSACQGTGPSSIARDLLVVVFAPETGAAQQAATAKRVGGKLLGRVGPSEPGAYYLRLPSGGGEFGLRAASDQLIQQPQVRQVGSRACPPALPPDTTPPGPSTQQPPEH
jgi:hypothetical protein